MKVHFSLVGTLVLTLLPVSCSRSMEPQIVGTWRPARSNELVFRADGEFKLSRADGIGTSGTCKFIGENSLA